MKTIKIQLTRTPILTSQEALPPVRTDSALGIVALKLEVSVERSGMRSNGVFAHKSASYKNSYLAFWDFIVSDLLIHGYN